MAEQKNIIQMDENTGTIYFYRKMFGENWENEISKDRSTDGYNDNIIYEHKDNLQRHGLYKTLSQAILYLVKFNMEGVPIPAKICLVSQEEKYCVFYNTKDFINIIEDIKTYGSYSASRGIDGFKPDKDIKSKTIHYDLESANGTYDLLTYINGCKGQVKVHITPENVWGWSRYYYDNAKKSDRTKNKFFQELENPQGVLKDLIYPWTGQREDFALIMDLLNDPQTQKKLGCYYTPLAYCDKVAELVRKAIAQVPNGNDYIILDRCAGTGNLEMSLTEEELSHVIINTYELQEWIALKNRLGSQVRYIIPPIPTNPSDLPKQNEYGFLSGANALSKEFIDNPIIKKYLDNPKCTIILLENPPYRDSSAADKESIDERENETMNTTSYIFAELQKVIHNYPNPNISTVREAVNQFAWSGFKYYLRQPTDCYILLSPAKCFKSLGMLDFTFGGGYLFNREHFHASAGGIMATLWYNVPHQQKQISLTPYDIDKKGHILPIEENEIIIRKVNSTFEKLFDRRKLPEDVETNVWCETNGKQNDDNRKCDGKSYYNENIIAFAHTNGYNMAAQNKYFTRMPLYDNRGTLIRSDNFMEMLPLFVAKCYPAKKWYEKDVLMTSGDSEGKFKDDKNFLKQCLIFTCLSKSNKCISFKGRDDRFYRNELCLDGDTLASGVIKTMEENDELLPVETKLIQLYYEILDEIKKKKDNGEYYYEEYDENISYGVFQISQDIDIKIPKTDNNGNIIYTNKLDKDGKKIPETVSKYGKDISHLITNLQNNLEQYYISSIKPNMIRYELVK